MPMYQADLPRGGKHERPPGSVEWRQDYIDMIANTVSSIGGLNEVKCVEIAVAVFDCLDDWGMTDAHALALAVRRVLPGSAPRQ